MNKEITSTLPFGNSKYVTKDKQMAIEFCNLKNSQVTLSLEEFLKNKFFILDVKIPPDLGENKFQKSPPYFENSPRSGGKRL